MNLLLEKVLGKATKNEVVSCVAVHLSVPRTCVSMDGWLDHVLYRREKAMRVCSKCGLARDLCLCSLIEEENRRTDRTAAKIPSWLKRQLRKRAIRLLMLRAGGRYRLFETGMLYHCLVLLGMHEYTRHKQVDELEEITCHYFHESDAEQQLTKLLETIKK